MDDGHPKDKGPGGIHVRQRSGHGRARMVCLRAAVSTMARLWPDASVARDGRAGAESGVVNTAFGVTSNALQYAGYHVHRNTREPLRFEQKNTPS